MEFKELSFQEFETAFKTIKRNKVSGTYDLNAGVILDVYEQIKYPLSVIFTSSIEKGAFPNLSKIAKASPFLTLVILPMLVIADQSQFYHRYQKY